VSINLIIITIDRVFINPIIITIDRVFINPIIITIDRVCTNPIIMIDRAYRLTIDRVCILDRLFNNNTNLNSTYSQAEPAYSISTKMNTTKTKMIGKVLSTPTMTTKIDRVNIIYRSTHSLIFSSK